MGDPGDLDCKLHEFRVSSLLGDGIHREQWYSWLYSKMAKSHHFCRLRVFFNDFLVRYTAVLDSLGIPADRVQNSRQQNTPPKNAQYGWLLQERKEEEIRNCKHQSS